MRSTHARDGVHHRPKVDITHEVCITFRKERITQKDHICLVDKCGLFVGPPEGIRTPVLQNRNLLRYPAAPRADIKGGFYSAASNFSLGLILFAMLKSILSAASVCAFASPITTSLPVILREMRRPFGSSVAIPSWVLELTFL